MYPPRLLAATLLGSLALAGAAACGPTDPARTSGDSGPGAQPGAAQSGAGEPGEIEAAALSPAALLKKSRAAAAAVDSVTVAFDLTHSGTRVTGTAAADRKGNCVLEMTQVGLGQFKAMRQAGADTVWIQYDSALLENAVGSGKAKLLKGKYLKISTDDPQAKDLVSNCDLGLNLLKTAGPGEGGLTWAGKQAGSVAGVVLKHDGGADGVTVVIAADGPPLLLEETNPGVIGGSFRFSGFDQPVTVTPPPSSEVVDMTK